ncbi:MAG: phosphatase PAP2 family protein [Melioribacter sp.]|nr:phosphatase PAP2 family protein [Melioribacter sp.]
MEKRKRIFFNFNPVDFIVIIFSLFLTILNLVFFKKIEHWQTNIIVNGLIISFVLFIAYKDVNNNLFWKYLHYIYLVPLILIFFKEIYYIVDPIRGVIYDDVLIKIDRMIFKTDPTHELYKIANPFLTELLQIVYATFFFLPIILGVDLILQNKYKELDYSAFIIVYGFLLSYIGYILVPAIGPRFTLHNFELNDAELPGLFLTNFLREVVNTGESIPKGTINPAAVVQRDAFPSGHTQMTLLVMILAVKFRSRLKYFFIIDGILLIFATVYLRYHYVVDLIGGFIFMLFTLWSGKYIYNFCKEMRTVEQVIFNCRVILNEKSFEQEK